MIRLKIIFIVTMVILVLIGALRVISNNLLLESYETIENAKMLRNSIRVESTIKNYQDSLNIQLRDWAQWDDTYQFAQDLNDEYIQSNLQDGSLSNLEINHIIYFNTNQELIYSKELDLSIPHDPDHLKSILDFIRYEDILTNRDTEGNLSGILESPEGLIFIEALPILKSDGTGPTMGTLLFGRHFDSKILSKFEELTQLNIEIFPYDSSNIPTDVLFAKKSFPTVEKFFVNPLSDETLASYFIINDLNKNPLEIVRITTAREISLQGKHTTTIFILISSAAILIFGLLVLL
ncbi:MAG: CHASE4 domain-containing protein, partial [Melioribacteraceae bacterium]